MVAMLYCIAYLVAGFAASAAGQGCAADNCLRAVRATAHISRGLADCSSFLRVVSTPPASTVTVTTNITATAWSTPTATTTVQTVDVVYVTIPGTVTTRSTIRAGPTALRRDAVPDVVFARPTPIGAVLNTEDGFLSLPEADTVTLARRQQPSAIPSYASACSGAPRYRSACSCIGVVPSTATAPAPVSTETITGTTTVTLVASTAAVTTVTETTTSTSTVPAVAVTAFAAPDGFFLDISSPIKPTPVPIGLGPSEANGWPIGPGFTGLAKFFIEDNTGRLYVRSDGECGPRVYANFRFVADDGSESAEGIYLNTEEQIRQQGRRYLSCDILLRTPQASDGTAAPRLWCTHPDRGTPVWFYDGGTLTWLGLMRSSILYEGDVTVRF